MKKIFFVAFLAAWLQSSWGQIPVPILIPDPNGPSFLQPPRIVSVPPVSAQSDLVVNNISSDGRLELFASFLGANRQIQVLQDFSGTDFGLRLTLPLSLDPVKMISARIDGDNLYDLVVLSKLNNRSGNRVDVVRFLGGNLDLTQFTTDTVFEYPGDSSSESYFSQIAAGDVDNDGDVDLIYHLVSIIAGENPKTFLLTNTGGQFQSKQLALSTLDDNRLAAKHFLLRDIDLDGDLDLVICLDTANQRLPDGVYPVQIYQGFGNGEFSFVGHLSFPVSPLKSEAVQFDNGWFPDLIVLDSDSISEASVHHFQQTAKFQFNLLDSQPVGRLAVDMAVADFNLDGTPEVVVPNTELAPSGFVGKFKLLKFLDPFSGQKDVLDIELSQSVGSILPGKLAVTDINNDAWPDIAFLGSPITGNSSVMGVLLQKLVFVTPTPGGPTPPTVTPTPQPTMTPTPQPTMTPTPQPTVTPTPQPTVTPTPQPTVTPTPQPTMTPTPQPTATPTPQPTVTPTPQPTMTPTSQPTMTPTPQPTVTPTPAGFDPVRFLNSFIRIDRYGNQRNWTALASPDLDQDGQDELACVSSSDDRLLVVRWNGGDEFVDFAERAMQNNPVSILAMPGKQSRLIAALRRSPRIEIIEYQSASGLQTVDELALDEEPQRIFAADAEGDGDFDLFSISAIQGEMTVFLQQVNGFAAGESKNVGDGALDVDAGNILGDASVEIASIFFNRTEMTVFQLISGRFLFPSLTRNLGSAPSQVRIADYDGDGFNDVAGMNRDANLVTLWLSEGIQGLQKRIQLPAALPARMTSADLTGDGAADLIITQTSGSSVRIIAGGYWDEPVEFPTASSPYAIATGDFNRDGRLDFAAASNTEDAITIYLSIPPASANDWKIHE